LIRLLSLRGVKERSTFIADSILGHDLFVSVVETVAERLEFLAATVLGTVRSDFRRLSMGL